MCKHDDGCNVPEGECSGACMTQQTSSETLEEIAERISARFVSGNSVAVERAHITSDEWRAISGHIPEVKALREENERLKGCKFSDRNYHAMKSRLTALESQLTELRQGGEAVGTVRKPDGAGVMVIWHKPPKDGTKLFAAPQPAIPPGYAVVERQLLEDAADSLGRFTNDHGWSSRDMGVMDTLVHVLAAAPSIPVAEKDASEYQRGFKDGYQRSDDEVMGCLS